MPPITSLAFLLLLFVGLPYLSARTHRQALALDRPSVYTSVAFTLWLVAGALLLVLAFEGQDLESIGLRGVDGAAPVTIALWTLAIVAGGCLIVLAAWVVRRVLNRDESPTIQHLIPRTSRERALLALILSPTAGFVEEVLYRGFAITRLVLLVGDPWLAALLAAAAFSLGHLYQGIFGAVRAGALGLLLAVPFLYTGSLWPSILAHALLDLVFGVFLYRVFLNPGEQEPRTQPLPQPDGPPEQA